MPLESLPRAKSWTRVRRLVRRSVRGVDAQRRVERQRFEQLALQAYAFEQRRVLVA